MTGTSPHYFTPAGVLHISLLPHGVCDTGGMLQERGIPELQEVAEKLLQIQQNWLATDKGHHIAREPRLKDSMFVQVVEDYLSSAAGAGISTLQIQYIDSQANPAVENRC